MKRITIQELTEGMQILRFDKTGVRFGYYGQVMPVGKLHEIQTQLTTAGVSYIYVKTPEEIQADITNEREAAAHNYVQLVQKSVAAKSVPGGTADAQVLSHEDITAAHQTHTQAKEITKSMLTDVRQGGTVDSATAKSVVSDLLSSYFRNHDAFVNMTRMKDMDNYTYTHSVNVSVISIAIGKRMGMSIKELEIIGLAGLLHDVGKMRIPEYILNKPDKLTEDEFRVMKEHPVYSYEIVKGDASIPEEVALACRQHHEKSNGTGYPDGLLESQISKYAKIIAIADVYDAITSERMYRKSMTSHDALKLIFSWSGKHFNDVLTKFFINLIGVYPVGTTVLLDTGELGIVIKPNKQNSTRPKIIIFADGEKNCIEPKLFDLSSCNLITRKPYKIIMGIVNPEDIGAEPDKLIEQYAKLHSISKEALTKED